MSRTYAQVAVRITLIVGVVAFLLYVLVIRGIVGGTTFATGSGQAGLSMTIDSTTIYNNVFQPTLSWVLKDLVPGVDKFFNFGDVKPGDMGRNSISIHIEQNPAYVCLDFTNLTNEENGVNEPEGLEDTSPLIGELAYGLEFFAWRDDGDTIFEVGELPLFGTSTQAATTVLNGTTYALADAISNPAYGAGTTHYVGIEWCAGDLAVNLTTAVITCDGEALGNEAQTDSMSVDVTLRAVQANEQPQFTCVPGGGGGGGNGDVEGCSPGYWRQPQHFGNWPAPYATSTLFSAVFENAFPGKTLLQVVSQGGGGLNALGRQTVAALLNASSTGYAYSAAEVIAKFNAVYPNGDYTTLKDDLEYNNTVYCPLGRDEGTSSGRTTSTRSTTTSWKQVETPNPLSQFVEKITGKLKKNGS